LISLTQKSTGTKSTDTKSTDTKSTDTKSTDKKSTDTKSTDTKSTDTNVTREVIKSTVIRDDSVDYLKKNIKISPLSYIRMQSNIPELELLLFFTNKQNEQIRDYVKNLNFKNKNKPVYAVKKYGNKYEFEIYLYRYKPDRYSPIKIVLDDMDYFPKMEDIDRINPNIRKCKLFKSNFIICSYDINHDTLKNGTSECNFYYGVKGGNNTTPFPYYILEENTNGDIVKTNEYGLINDIMPSEQQYNYLVEKFTSGNEVVFFAKKPLKNTECIYIEGMNYKNFIYFLTYFEYESDFINFCKKNYDDSYKFCVSYDLDDKKQTVKTTIFGIYN
jgi:hypothetical protein